MIVDGHDLPDIDRALTEARADGDQPTVLLAKTIKAKGVPQIEDKNGWHGKALPPDMAEKAIAALGGPSDLHITTQHPAAGTPAITPDPSATITLPSYRLGEKVATRVAFGAAIAALAARPAVVVIDGEVGNSTHAEEFQKVCPQRYFEVFIAEQQLVAAAVGLAVRGYIPFAATFAVFFSRAYDFIRMAGISQVNIRLVGSHAGVEIGEDGPSQMALEDLAALRAVHGSVVLYPADTAGIVYLRTTRGAYPVLYPAGEDFPVGGAKIHRAGSGDQVALIGAGVMVHECLTAAGELAAAGTTARVIDAYSVKPIDRDTLIDACLVTGSRLVVAEDHYPEGGPGQRGAGGAGRRRGAAVAGRTSGGAGAARLGHAGRTARHRRNLSTPHRRRCPPARRAMTRAHQEVPMSDAAAARGRPEPVAGQHHPRPARQRHARELHRRVLDHRAHLQPDDLRQGHRGRRRLRQRHRSLESGRRVRRRGVLRTRPERPAAGR